MRETGGGEGAERQGRGRGRPATFDRDRTIEVAVESYWREGPEGVSLNEICRRACVSKPGLYREFGGEDGLMTAALAYYGTRVVEPMLKMLATERPFREVLRELVDWITTEHDTPAGCLLARMRATPVRLGESTTAAVEALRDQSRAAYEAWYASALARGEVNPAIEPEMAAYFLDTQLTTILSQMAADEPPTRVRAQADLAFRSLLPPSDKP